MDVTNLENTTFLLSPLFVALLASLSVLFLWLAITAFRTPDDVDERLTAIMDYSSSKNLIAEEETAIRWKFLKGILFHLLKALGRFGPRHNSEKIDQMLAEAGNPAKLTALDYIGLRMLSAIVLMGFSFLFATKREASGETWLFILLFTVVGYMLPSFWLRRRIKKRQQDILRAMPDAIDMLTIGVEAGLSFEASMLRVSVQWDNELTRAFRRAVVEIRLGEPRATALHHMAKRSGVQELRSFVAILNQSVQLGISIVNVLRSQAEDMRQQRRQRAEELAHQATVKMVFPLVFLIFPALFVVILGPAVSLFADLFGIVGH